MYWPMHKSRGITCIMWKDKKSMLLISTNSILAKFLSIQNPLSIPRHDGDTCNYIITSPVHHEYTIHMCGVDVADQLQASYSC